VWIINALRSRAALAERVSELERVVAAVDKRSQDAELNVADLYERCRNLLKKTARERVRIEAAETPTDPEAAPSPSNGQLPQGGSLTERQRTIQQQILRRRAGI
jgi:hypothetical protein